MALHVELKKGMIIKLSDAESGSIVAITNQIRANGKVTLSIDAPQSINIDYEGNGYEAKRRKN